jgi:hypothetical protein
MSQPGRNNPPPRLSPLSLGLQWATTITTIGFEMALPTLAGWWLDQKFKTAPVWTIVLAVLGIVVAMRHLWEISKRLGRASRSAGATTPSDRTPSR